jgi:adenosylcobinamide-phosphate synthase
MLCFAILPGPTGPILYRLAAQLDKLWGRRVEPEDGEFGAFARRAFQVIDWLPQRVTAAGFAVVGDFEDAAYCWRTQADRWPESSSGILLASGGGALGVRLGMPLSEGGGAVDRSELGMGEEADVDFMQSAIGLVWRTLVLFVSIFALIGVASWVGR